MTRYPSRSHDSHWYSSRALPEHREEALAKLHIIIAMLGNQSEVGRRIGVNASTIRAYLRGRAGPSEITADRIIELHAELLERKTKNA